MNKEIISDGQAIYMVVLFVMGSTLILGTSGVAKNDAWISGIIAIIMVLPVILAYSRILSIFKGMDIYDIIQILFGKIIGKIIIVLCSWYAFHLGALVLRNFGEFINTAALPETPMILSMILLGVLSIMSVKLGVEVMARSAKIFLPIVIIVIAIVNLLAIPETHFNLIRPVMYNGFLPVLKNAFIEFSFPFAETVVFTSLFFSLKTKKSPYKVYLIGILIGGIFVISFDVRNTLIIGTILQSKSYYPSYEALRRINVSDFLQRVEVFATLVYVITAYTKSSICLFAACNGISKTFGLKSYRSIVVQTGIVMILLAHILYDNIMEMRNWAFETYPYYAVPFQVILPLIILIAAEIKVRSRKT